MIRYYFPVYVTQIGLYMNDKLVVVEEQTPVMPGGFPTK